MFIAVIYDSKGNKIESKTFYLTNNLNTQCAFNNAKNWIKKELYNGYPPSKEVDGCWFGYHSINGTYETLYPKHGSNINEPFGRIIEL